jgi:hypothetical protein
VVDVHDEVAHLQVAQIGQERLRELAACDSGARRSSSKTSVSA